MAGPRGVVLNGTGAFYTAKQAFLGALGANERARMAANARKYGVSVQDAAPDAPAQVVYASRRFVAPKARPNPGSYVLPSSTGYEAVRALAEAAAPAFVAAVDKHMTPLAFAAFRAWPWDTGLSRMMLDYRFETRDGLIIGAFASDAPYTRYIKSHMGAPRVEGGPAPTQSPWQVLVRTKERAVASAIISEAGSNLRIYARAVRR